MATTFGPERVLGPTTTPGFDSMPDSFVAPYGNAADSPSLRPQNMPRADIPPPNPHFVFPAQASPALPRTSGRRPMSAIESPTQSFDLSAENADRSGRAALPSFCFNPGASLPPDPQPPFFLSPQISPNTPRGIQSPNRPTGHGHRRGGSEFVGGRLREGSSIAVMSTSPTRPEGGADPSFQPPRRRHRRGISGAISTNDLPILQPPTFDPLGRGSSAPNSPTGFDRRDDTTISSQQGLPPPELPLPPPILEKPQPLEIPKVVEPEASNSPKDDKPAFRSRVGFSDTLEFIPRPLSLVSSDASSTATARPGHSVSGSISSIVSGSFPTGRESPAPLSRSQTKETSDSRPSTAGAILENIQDLPSPSSPRRRNSIPTLSLMPDPAQVGSPEPSPTKSTKRWSFFARESLGAGSPSKARPQSSCSLDSPIKAAPTTPSEHKSDMDAPQLGTKPKKSKKSKKKKKVKGWAGSILPKKPKGHGKRTKDDMLRPPTPQGRITFPHEEDGMNSEPEMLDLPTPTVTVTESPDPPQTADVWRRPEEESSLSMIDLDAALGPFNTPLPHNPEWEAAQRAAGNTGKRRLHSAQGMKGFSGPGMHYHRRAESAPDLPPFDAGRAGIHRFASSSTMADVFEEDEEEDDDDDDDLSRSDPTDGSEQSTESDGEITPPAASTSSKDPMLDVQDRMSTHSISDSIRRHSSGPFDKDQSASNSVRAEHSRTSLHDSVILEEPSSVIFRTTNVFSERADTSDSATATPSPRRFASKDLAPVDISPLHLPTSANMPVSPYAMSQSSSFPSPRSPMSVDAQRISTAPSSVADENNFQSLLMGEPGPEVRISVDYDIPSLTSSNSTMTRDSAFIPGPRMSQPTLRDQRPVSVSSGAVFGRRRSSLASLSRLISSSHGERSKLSMEVTLDNETENRKHKNSKTKRLGRMMQFWKPHHKEGTSS